MTDLELIQIKNWFEQGTVTDLIEANFCSNRSEFNGRLISYETLLEKSFAEECLYLASSSIGEIGNNCFDHNLGFWQDQPGCLFIREKNFCLIADRGQGIKSSLSKVYTLAPHENSYIQIAFERVITGRAPERRGNGLKYAKKNILACGLSLYCVSSSEEMKIGEDLQGKFQALLRTRLENAGTLTLISW